MNIDFRIAGTITNEKGTWLCIKVDEPQEVREFCESMNHEKTYTAAIDLKHKKRSLNANAYFWLMAGKLAAVLHVEKEYIYRSYIKEIGNNFEIMPVRNDAKKQWKKNWESRGLGWICEEIGDSKFDNYTNMICYYGSSTYDTKQMSCLIDFVVNDCKDQGIDTETPRELQKIKERWKS